jgi:hypothetical protein
MTYWGSGGIAPRIFNLSVGIALGYGLDVQGSRVQFPVGAGTFLFITASRTPLRPTQPPIQWEPGVLSLGVKRPGRKADHSLPSTAEVKNAWSYTSIPQYTFMAWCLVKHRDNFTLRYFTLPNLLYWMAMNGQFYAPAALFPGKEAQIFTRQEVGGEPKVCLNVVDKKFCSCRKCNTCVLTCR